MKELTALSKRNSLARYCTLRHHLREYRSTRRNFPGGRSTTLAFKVKRWLGVSGSGTSGSFKGLFIWRWGTLRRWSTPPRWGNQSLHTISLFFLYRVHTRGGVPHWDGLSGQPGRVTALAGLSFLHVKAGVMPIRASINMVANHYRPYELSRQFHLRKVEKNSFNEENTEEMDSGASDNLSMGPIIKLRSTKRKASSVSNVHQPKSAKKSNKIPSKVRAWTLECRWNFYWNILKNTKLCSTLIERISAMYTEIRRCLGIDYFDLAPTAPPILKSLWTKRTVRNMRTTKKRVLTLTPVPRGCMWRLAFFGLRVGGVPDLPGVPHLHVNRPQVIGRQRSGINNTFCFSHQRSEGFIVQLGTCTEK